MSSQFDRERVIELVGRLCDDEINTDEVSELEAILRLHGEARRLYHLTVSLHRDLELCDITEAQSVQLANTDRSRSRSTKLWVSIAVAACLLITASFFVFRGSHPEAPAVPTLATVTDAVGVKWGTEQPAIDIGDGVPPGRIRMNSGTICLTFQHGVVMTVESPADFELISKEHVKLHDGRVVAYVPDGAEGFTVTTDAAKVVDLGTEFAVATSDDGSSEVTVFDGEVDLVATKAIETAPQRVVAGLAWRVDLDGEAKQDIFRPADFDSVRSVIRQQRVIRESFRLDQSFPGRATKGWTSPWSVSLDNFTMNEDVTGIHTELPLISGTRNYLTILGAGSPDEDVSSIRLTRSFDEYEAFDPMEPYTIEVLLRLESDPGALRQIKLFGVQVPFNPNHKRSSWHISTARPETQSHPRWQLYKPQQTQFNTLALSHNQTYRFLIEVHPEREKWRASISDGTNSIWNTLKDGNPLRLKPDEQHDQHLLGCELNCVPGSELRFSIDGIRIQNNPNATQESKHE